MSKKLSFAVTLTFSDKIQDDTCINEIAQNIAQAIKKEAVDGNGITPDYADSYTQKIEIKPQFLDDVFEVEVNNF